MNTLFWVYKIFAILFSSIIYVFLILDTLTFIFSIMTTFNSITHFCIFNTTSIPTLKHLVRALKAVIFIISIVTISLAITAPQLRNTLVAAIKFTAKALVRCYSLAVIFITIVFTILGAITQFGIW